MKYQFAFSKTTEKECLITRGWKEEESVKKAENLNLKLK